MELKELAEKLTDVNAFDSLFTICMFVDRLNGFKCLEFDSCLQCKNHAFGGIVQAVEGAIDKLDAVERECELLEMGSEHDRNVAGRFRRAIGREPDTAESLLAEMARIIESCSGEDLLPLVERYKRLQGGAK